jgi:hypothetical protein
MLVTFTESADGSLTMSFRTTRSNGAILDGGPDPTCPFLFTIEGQTAVATRGHTATEGNAIFSFVSGSFQADGSLTLVEKVTPAPNTDVKNAIDTSTSRCTKNP